MKTIGQIAIFVLASVALLLAHTPPERTLSPSPLQAVAHISDQGFTLPSRLEGTIRARVLSEQNSKTDHNPSDPCLAAVLSDVEKQVFYSLANSTASRPSIASPRTTNNPREPPAA